MDNYIQSLDEARAADKIDEKTFLFLRSHKVVLDSLMDITQGDYARFNSNTYLEVYDYIRAKMQKKYRDETTAHELTRQELKDVKAHTIEKDQTIQKLSQKVQTLEDEKQRSKEITFEKKVDRWGWLFTFIVAGIPYLVLQKQSSGVLRRCVNACKNTQGKKIS